MERDQLAQESGLRDPLSDLMDWMLYYDPVLKNYATALFQLKRFPERHLEEHTIFMVTISHKRDMSLPVPHRFNVLRVSREDRTSIPPSLKNHFDIPGRANYVDMGKIEMGQRYFGTGSYLLVTDFGQGAWTTKHKFFGIDKDIAKADVVRSEWWLLFLEYITAGAKMKFCCGKIEGMEDVCCCGGWAHHSVKQTAFRNLSSSASSG
ncbi:hypothetical protein GYMLUDRAFT_262435 [Collybiopsis luxurians FD-317 M1]|uniref:Uncharacterized protein n=1 Tax=Collybiopsis luxurians FD-317 M1 TaxID=944289 RepID=A0A0D0C814_9AGAR|nr:hypothetical protein GYMLUDRAFT_262435 [Collybiopsis luxurians FD-317 M1]